MIVIIDNYDSFTYNLVQALGELGASIRVYRNDKTTLRRIERCRPTHILISPGPCTPKEGGISNDAIRHFAGKVPIMGVCLGHQCIAYAMGGVVTNAPRLMHGKTSMIHHDGRAVYEGLPNPFEATRYHSLIVEERSLPDIFTVTARTKENEIMGIRHNQLPIEGLQFHPESFLTADGPAILRNFLKQTP